MRLPVPVVTILLMLMPAHLPAAPTRDPRTVEILRYGCASEFGRREVTLFGNGTVRLRQGPWDAQELSLHELGPEALNENLRVLQGIYGNSEVDKIRRSPDSGIGGSWVERCEIHLDLPNLREPLQFEFSSYDVPPLRISRLIHIADQLADLVRPVVLGERLPKDYKPQFGDVLHTSEGVRFQVLRLTVDRLGVEVQGLEQPVRLYIALEDLDKAFVSVEKSGENAWWWSR